MRSSLTTFRPNKIGLFAKVRRGAIVFSQVVDSQVPPIPSETTYSKSPNFVLDTGGVVEVYPARHIVLRIEAGNETIFYHSRTIQIGHKPYSVPGSTAASFLFLTGAGIRF